MRWPHAAYPAVSMGARRSPGIRGTTMQVKARYWRSWSQPTERPAGVLHPSSAGQIVGPGEVPDATTRPVRRADSPISRSWSKRLWGDAMDSDILKVHEGNGQAPDPGAAPSGRPRANGSRGTRAGRTAGQLCPVRRLQKSGSGAKPSCSPTRQSKAVRGNTRRAAGRRIASGTNGRKRHDRLGHQRHVHRGAGQRGEVPGHAGGVHRQGPFRRARGGLPAP